MRNTIEMLLASGVTSGTGLEWRKACSAQAEDGFVTYFDPATVRRDGDVARMWHLHDFKTAQVVAGKTYLSVNNWVEYDRKTERRRTLYISLNAENMGAGATIHSNDIPSAWTPVAPSSIAAVLRRLACEGKYLLGTVDTFPNREIPSEVIDQIRLGRDRSVLEYSL